MSGGITMEGRAPVANAMMPLPGIQSEMMRSMKVIAPRGSDSNICGQVRLVFTEKLEISFVLLNITLLH